MSFGEMEHLPHLAGEWRADGYVRDRRFVGRGRRVRSEGPRVVRERRVPAPVVRSVLIDGTCPVNEVFVTADECRSGRASVFETLGPSRNGLLDDRLAGALPARRAWAGGPRPGGQGMCGSIESSATRRSRSVRRARVEISRRWLERRTRPRPHEASPVRGARSGARPPTPTRCRTPLRSRVVARRFAPASLGSTSSSECPDSVRSIDSPSVDDAGGASSASVREGTVQWLPAGLLLDGPRLTEHCPSAMHRHAVVTARWPVAAPARGSLRNGDRLVGPRAPTRAWTPSPNPGRQRDRCGSWPG